MARNCWPGILIYFMSKNNSKAGFTILELLVSSFIIIIIFSFVVANFRAAQYAGEIGIVLKEVVDGITTVRNFSLGGRTLSDGTFPVGGYGIHFDRALPSQFIIFADDILGSGYSPGEELSNGIKQFDSNIQIVSLCGLDENIITLLPCEIDEPITTLRWDDLNPLTVMFSLPSDISSLTCLERSRKV